MPLDLRVIQIGIEVNGQMKTYSGLAMSASGTKYANANQNECEIKIFNLDKATRDYILTETSPYNLNRTPKRAVVRAGRASYGTTQIYSGNIVSSIATQPPDIGLTLKCLTGNFLKGKLLSRSSGSQAPLAQIAKEVANDLGLTLDFQATNKTISNYNFSGAALKEIDGLNQLGGINAFVDDELLIIKNTNAPLSNRTRILNQSSGMVGVPEITEQGLKVKFLLDNVTVLGGQLRIQSAVNPSVNGDYIIYKLSFDIATRDTPFYWIAEAKRV